MGIQETIELLRATKNEAEWNDVCDRVKASFDGKYPSWWYREIIMGGVCSNTAITIDIVKPAPAGGEAKNG